MAQIPLPTQNHAVGTKETFKLRILQRLKNRTRIPLPLTGYRVVVSISRKSSASPLTKDSNRSTQLRVTPDEGRIEFTLEKEDLSGDEGQALTYQLALDVPGGAGVPRGAVHLGQGTFTTLQRKI